MESDGIMPSACRKFTISKPPPILPDVLKPHEMLQNSNSV